MVNHTSPGSGLKSTHDIFFPLKLFGVAVVYALLAGLALTLTGFSTDGVIGVFWPASGWALAILLIGGRRYAWGLFAGALLPNLIAGVPLPAAVLSGAGGTAGALMGHWLLTRDRKFHKDLLYMGDFGRLIWKAAIPASACSAFLGVNAMTAFGVLALADNDRNLLHWLIGDALGILVITPLILIWRQPPEQLKDMKRWPEAALGFGLTLLIGQMIFLGWFPDLLPTLPRKGYWLLAPIFWAAYRLGPHGAIFLLCALSTQTLLSVQKNVGFFAGPEIDDRMIDGSLFIALAAPVMMFMALYINDLKRAKTDLRIAATAFECQEGMIVTDADMRILRTNQSFTRIMGYTDEEVVGKTTTFMRSDRHPTEFYENAWATGRREGSWQSEVWHRRKNGEVFQQWLTCTAVKDEDGAITNFVVTHMDITAQKQREAQRLADEAVHRDALVREVHHRIKNNLQGISGMLRQFAQEHPETADIINQAITQVRSVAVLHGLQGRTSMDTVRLCELTSAIASDVQSVWQTPIAVDIPSIWTPGIIAEKEAVPIALVLNELLVNAVKHGGKAQGHVSVTLRKGQHEESIQVSIRNSGRLRANTDRPTAHHAGLQLVGSLMPHEGASLIREQHENEVLTRLELEPPVVHLESRSLYESA